MRFSVSLSSPSAVPVTVTFTTADGTAVAPDDYTTSSGTITFAPGETSQTVPVEVQGDTSAGLDEWFKVILRRPENATLGRAGGIGTITEDDGPPVAVTADAFLSDLTVVVDVERVRPGRAGHEQRDGRRG